MESAPSAHRGGVELPRSARCRPVNHQTLGTRATLPPSWLVPSLPDPHSPSASCRLQIIRTCFFCFFFLKKEKQLESLKMSALSEMQVERTLLDLRG